MDFCDFWLPLGSPHDHFGSIWRSLGSILGQFYNQVRHRCTERDPGRSQGGFLMIFDGFWVSLWRPFWITFWYFLSFEVSKSMFGLQAWLLLTFELKICWFLMSQPLIYIVNTDVFFRFHIFDFFMNLMISGSCLDLILDTFGSLGTPIWWFLGYWRLLETLMNFRVPPGPPQAEWTRQGGGKVILQGVQ